MAYKQLLPMKLLSRKRKADFESGLSSFLINEEILRKRCLHSILTRLRRHRNQDHQSSASLEGLIDVAQEAILEISRIICLLPFLYLQMDNSSASHQ